MTKPHFSIIQLIKQHIPDARRGAEVGVYKAATSRKILEAFPDLHMTLVDLWKEHLPGSVYYDAHKVMGRMSQSEWDQVFQAALHNLEALKGHYSLLFADSVKAASCGTVPDDSLDFVFLDANHMYAEVLADILAWNPKVRVGGLITGHDYGGKLDRRGIWGVSKAVHEVFGQEKVMALPGAVWAVIKEAA